MNPAEAAITEHGDHIAGAGGFLDLGDDRFDIGQIPRLSAEAGDVGGESVGIEPVVFRDLVKIRDGGDDGEIRGGEGLGQLGLENGAARGVGARLEQNPQTPARMTLAQTLHRETNGRRMMGEIVDDLDAVDLALEFLAAGDTFEGFQPVADFIGGKPGEGRGGGGHGGVADVELAGHRHRKGHAAQTERAVIGRVTHILDPQTAVFPETDGGDGTRGGGGDVETVRFVAIDEGVTLARDDVEQAAEGELDLVERVVNVRVVELDVVHDDALGQVVEELRALVEEGGVVFIAFQHVELRVGEMRAAAEVFR